MDLKGALEVSVLYEHPLRDVAAAAQECGDRSPGGLKRPLRRDRIGARRMVGRGRRRNASRCRLLRGIGGGRLFSLDLSWGARPGLLGFGLVSGR